MWQSPEDLKNPWRPFRRGSDTPDRRKTKTTTDTSHLARLERKAHVKCQHRDENWNSVKLVGEKNKYETDQDQGCNRRYLERINKCGDEKGSSLHTKAQLSGPNVTCAKRENKTVSSDTFEVKTVKISQTGWPEGQPPNQPCIRGGNQWSPFLKGHSDLQGDQGKVQLEHHKSDCDESYYSEKSSYSTDTDDAPEEDFEIIDHEEGLVNKTEGTGELHHPADPVTGERFNTPLTSPSLNERFHTAPNSPRSDQDGFCIVNHPNECNQCDNVVELCPLVETVDNVPNMDQSYSTRYKAAAAVSNDHNKDKTNNRIESDKKTSLETFTDNITACLEDAMEETKLSESQKQEIANFRRFSERFDRSRIPKMELPPFIDVANIQYEADPRTGAVRTVGKGSFGQVFKARFADPALRHLRIVVKEFNEEYTNRQEILEEAKRLLYLGETGYVPVCYGLVSLGDVDNPTFGLVQEYIGSGLTLEQVLWDHYELEIHWWLSIAFQACEGLARFHEKGILLNDIKSNNIILEFYRTIVRIKYIDFGLATDMRGKRYKNSKSLEDFVYLAPEVRKDGRRTNIASDIFSLGYMLEQICSTAEVHELSFMTRLCMDIDPDARLPVRAAANIIYEHMIAFGYDTSSLCR